MNIEPLIPMANRIGEFFETMRNREQGMQEIAHHIRSFWDPRMRSALLSFIELHPDGQGPEGCLSPIVLEAVQSHAAQLQPKT
ncbi:formate dehydrogenase subunit delta [Alcaligenes endophyticus]|uniref:Formate dehydrogenase subunit delta n=1 Tax=Alcaligenes endophyticus TaxID=1929088 RepID=A0ABT8EGT4_9BURK|nr:formate dehydrogenase subunit delta [Alcaligenes endophyticus]MCX5589841.1 formate dehydrogenase subunit delta [Alcaligenes endophyticus]MDN4120496.1 formate dehydrogenase subunit delta [Alcaligenes endophyticus]